MNLLDSLDLTKGDILKIFDIADRIEKGERFSLKKHPILVLYFEKPSTRTRIAFESAITELGGNAIFIDEKTTQRTRGETLSDIAKILSGYSDFIAARLYKHKDLLEIAKNSSVPVINALDDLEHPTQALADVYTIRNHRKNLSKTSVAFVGDIATNTANSLMTVFSRFGGPFTLIGPKSVNPNATYVNKAREYCKVSVTDDIEDGLEDVDVVYTDTYVSMGEELEAEQRRKLFAPYQVNSAMLKYAKKDAIVMHCLMAHRGEEITGEVIDGPKSVVWEQARNKKLLNKAILIYLSQSEDDHLE
ncbi:MAG: ornithine carbamoyltransferase [Candidatus Marsarchaeota archaeon]|nr:ornithine carbamoyltransferase [Candidatus Marsarchaeota archaeon]